MFIKNSVKKREDWKKQISKDIYSLDEGDYGQLDKHIENKKIILLGENSHWVSEFYTSKINLIKFLHKKHGFNVVVLESGLLEAKTIDLSNVSDTKKELKNSLLGIYQNEEMDTLFKEKNIEKLSITGMDIQPVNRHASNWVISWVKDNLKGKIGSQIEQIEDTFFELDDLFKKQEKIPGSLKGKIRETIQGYEVILLQLNRDLTYCKDLEKQKKLKIIHRGMINRQQWLLVNLKGRIGSGSLRDTFMFENIKWLMDYFKGEKLIIWSHNYHIRKNRSLLLKLFGIKTVGQLLTKKYSHGVFTVGFYGGSGSCFTPFKDLYEIDIKNKYHLELLLMEFESNNLFLPVNHHLKKKEKPWYSQNWWLLETRLLGMSPIVLKPYKFYDAIYFIRHVSPPKKL